jgi:hypothetical protein
MTLTVVEPPLVRLATKAEEEEIMVMCREIHAENGLVAMDEGKVREMLHKAFNREGGIIGVIGKPGALEAIIMIVMTSFWSSNETHLEELFAYVRRPFRTKFNREGETVRQPHAELLVRFAKQCSDEIGVPLVIGIITNRRMKGKVRLYQTILGYPAGAYFVVNPKWINNEDLVDKEFWKSPFPKVVKDDKRERQERHQALMAERKARFGN